MPDASSKELNMMISQKIGKPRFRLFRQIKNLVFLKAMRLLILFSATISDFLQNLQICICDYWKNQQKILNCGKKIETPPIFLQGYLTYSVREV
jgi:hypothetical protein